MLGKRSWATPAAAKSFSAAKQKKRIPRVSKATQSPLQPDHKSMTNQVPRIGVAQWYWGRSPCPRHVTGLVACSCSAIWCWPRVRGRVSEVIRTWRDGRGPYPDETPTCQWDSTEPPGSERPRGRCPYSASCACWYLLWDLDKHAFQRIAWHRTHGGWGSWWLCSHAHRCRPCRAFCRPSPLRWSENHLIWRVVEVALHVLLQEPSSYLETEVGAHWWHEAQGLAIQGSSLSTPQWGHALLVGLV